MGGCNCGKSGKKKLLNNTKNQETLQIVDEAFKRLVEGKQIEDISELDWIELYTIWRLLYPNASGSPSQNQVLNDINTSRQFLRVKYVKK